MKVKCVTKQCNLNKMLWCCRDALAYTACSPDVIKQVGLAETIIMILLAFPMTTKIETYNLIRHINHLSYHINYIGFLSEPHKLHCSYNKDLSSYHKSVCFLAIYLVMYSFMDWICMAVLPFNHNFKDLSTTAFSFLSVAWCHIIVLAALWFKLVLLAWKILFKGGFYLYVLT